MSFDSTVSIVLPNFNGKQHLDACLRSLADLDYPKDKIRIIIVDNGSVDGSVAYLRSAHRNVEVLENGENLGFSAACNLGARLGRNSDIVVFLNNDMRVEKTFLSELVRPIIEKRADCTAAKILSWDGRTIDYAGGGMTFHGIGFQAGHGLLATDRAFQKESETLFACGGAMAVSSDVFDKSGGFDEDYFAYYEDADLGWRLWILGYKILFIPASVCYHHHSATSKTFPQEQIRLLQVRNPLLTIIKNYGEQNAAPILASALLLAARRGLDVGGIDVNAFRIEKTRSRATGGMREVFVRAQRRLDRKVSIPKNAVADFVAMADLGEMLPRILAKRRTIQQNRKRADAEIVKLFKNPFWCVEPRETYQILQKTLEEFMKLKRIFE
ncbi:MAG: glycosyltransferase family 2 protein [Planctomycetota bacterium]